MNKPIIDYVKTSKWLETVAFDYNKKIKNLSVVFCNDEYILELNKKYLNHNYYTDIITFDYSTKKHISGDLIISIETIETNAKKYKTQFENELFRVMVHGILHLSGFKDDSKESQEIMRNKENFYLDTYFL